jgi:hypothetical protein
MPVPGVDKFDSLVAFPNYDVLYSEAKQHRLTKEDLHNALDKDWVAPTAGNILQSGGEKNDKIISMGVAVILNTEPSLKKYFTVDKNGISYWENGKNKPPVVVYPLKGVSDPTPGEQIKGAADAITSPLTFFTSQTFWLRVGEVLFGIVLFNIGIKAATGYSPAGTVKKAALYAPK